jgi:predicted DNA-binding transcriptional regulator YafY
MLKELTKLLERKEVAELIYMKADGSLTKRRVKVLSIQTDSIWAYCFLRRERRTFKIDRILAVRKVVVREGDVI